MIDYKVICAKLQYLCISELARKFCSSYIPNIRQRVRANNHLSSPKPVIAGVLRGSVWEPLLFLLYTFYLTNYVSNLQLL